MRYIIEIIDRKAKEELNDFLLNNKEGAKLIESYEPIEKLQGKVEVLGRLLNEYKQSGISWDVFNYYLRGKGINQKEIDSVMGGVELFFSQFKVRK